MVTTTKKATVTKVTDAWEFQVADLLPMQRELQRLAAIAVKRIAESTGGVVYGKLLISLDYVHPRRNKISGHFSKRGWMDAEGNHIASIGINPYDLGDMTHATIFGVILHEVIHFVSSFTENKILFGFKKSTNIKLYPDGYTSDTTNGGKYHGPSFAKVTGMVPWLECFKHSDSTVGNATRLSESGIKAASKILKPGIFDGLHKQMEEPSTKSKSQYVGYVCQLDGCQFAIQVSGGIVKAIDEGTQRISEHCNMDMVKK